jgi:hypothetical protein
VEEEKEREQELERAVPEVPTADREERIHGFAKRDRIWIKNTVRKPASWNNNIEWNGNKARSATVTKVLIKGPVVQVHFITDNGVSTWRAPNNVCLITAQQTAP